MYPVYDGVLTPGTVNGGPPAAPTNPIMVPLDQNIVSLDIYNMSPFRLQISVSGGQPDIYMGPNSSKEHVYIGRQAGASLNVATLKGHPTSIIIKALTFTTGLSTFTGAFSVMGFREDEDWTDRKRPIVTGSINPVLGGNPTASQLINLGASPGTNVINTNANPGSGSMSYNNDGSGTRNLLDNGNFVAVESFTNGTNITPAVAAYGTPTDLNMTTFNGTGNFNNTTIGALISAGGIATIGHWVSVARSSGTHVTVNTQTTITSWNASASGGTFRISGYINKLNVTASAVTFRVDYTDPFGTGSHTSFLSCDNDTGAYIQLRGITTVTNKIMALFPIEIAHLVGNTITVSWTDPTGTANDWVIADIEQFVL